MGLDMYLYIKKSKYEDFKECEYPEELKGLEKDIEERNFKSMTSSVECQVAYWRKANAIHNWFVNNCANGNDDCEKMYVSKDKLEELLKDCEIVISNPNQAKEILPTTKGFFFGSQEYDEWYFEDLQYTVKVIKKVLSVIKKLDKAPNNILYQVIYRASW